ncbi:hypothetical protein [Haloterrigena alkaliphila]|uniref:CARDB domain-containing protein n=1 Tax=Haloterrigena alkaliphila TaxID=2816475 RepID=A0A8A2VA82_9EURY|nr:hypothetical protein [Haloterrigena alkaliphila]QSW98949.1 hypothetical protein J0X25_16425 [Haloterrigena alkaliphila]
MERRTFMAGTGVSIGIGLAGCLNTADDTDDGNNTEEIDTGDGENETSEGEAPEGTGDESVDTGTDDEDNNTDDNNNNTDDGDNGDSTDETSPARFEVTAMSTNSPIGPRELLTVNATIENVGDETGTTDVELVVGNDSSVEDSQSLTLESGESADITLKFRAGEPSGNREEFPVGVDTGAHEVSETVVVQSGGNGDIEEDVTFDSCERATVSGSFEAGDIAYASTVFYDEAGVGDTLMEDGVTIGEDVSAPFTGTIVFELADQPGVVENEDEILVRVSDYGEYGTVIAGLTTDQDDYVVAGITHSNPNAEECIDEIEAEWEEATGGN